MNYAFERARRIPLVIAGKQQATMMVLLIAIVIGVLTTLAILILSRPAITTATKGPLHSQASGVASDRCDPLAKVIPNCGVSGTTTEKRR
jgi:hypothetical protein